jgi:hypothetical protein
LIVVTGLRPRRAARGLVRERDLPGEVDVVFFSRGARSWLALGRLRRGKRHVQELRHAGAGEQGVFVDKCGKGGLAAGPVDRVSRGDKGHNGIRRRSKRRRKRAASEKQEPKQKHKTDARPAHGNLPRYASPVTSSDETSAGCGAGETDIRLYYLSEPEKFVRKEGGPEDAGSIVPEPRHYSQL